jgi:hypothetical protein
MLRLSRRWAQESAKVAGLLSTVDIPSVGRFAQKTRPPCRRLPLNTRPTAVETDY